MKRKNISIFLLCLGVVSCSITGRLEKDKSRLGLSQPSQNNKVDTFSLSGPKLITYTDKDGKEQTITRNEKDVNSGEEMSVIDLQGVTVTSRSKNVPERFGKVNLDFIVTVPNHLISKKWQLQLTPELIKSGNKIELEKILLSGADFLKTQKKGYAMYQAFMSSIIPNEEYLQRLFDEKGYKKAMADLEEEFYQSWKKDLLSEKEYIDWTNTVNQRYWFYNGIMTENKKKIEGYNTILSKLPSHWLYRDVTSQTTPAKYRNFLDGNYSLEKKTITSDDSTQIAKRFFDYKKMAENERRKEQLEEKYKKYVQFPYESARLDTIIQGDSTFQYYYVQEIETDDNVRKLDLTLSGLVLAKDASTFKVPSSDTITYYISSMSQFLDRTPRYKLKIIERKSEVNMVSYISYKSGKVTIDESMGENASELTTILNAYKNLTFSGELVLDSINITAGASPEGSSGLNYQLSKLRAKSIKQYLSLKTNDPEGIDTLVSPVTIGEDWNKLVQLIALDEKMPQKNKVLDIINTVRNPDIRERQIISKAELGYAYMREHLYPQLRGITFKFNLHRRGMVKDTLHTTVIDSVYNVGLELLETKKYKEALTILSDYNDYNAAVGLMSLGYDSKAYDILSSEEETPNRNYLLSILAVRMKKEEEAVKLLIKACQADESKIWRGKLDPEINALMTTYNLYQNAIN